MMRKLNAGMAISIMLALAGMSTIALAENGCARGTGTINIMVPGGIGDHCVTDQVQRVEVCAPDEWRIADYSLQARSEMNAMGRTATEVSGDCVTAVARYRPADHRGQGKYTCSSMSVAAILVVEWCSERTMDDEGGPAE